MSYNHHPSPFHPPKPSPFTRVLVRVLSPVSVLVSTLVLLGLRGKVNQRRHLCYIKKNFFFKMDKAALAGLFCRPFLMKIQTTSTPRRLFVNRSVCQTLFLKCPKRQRCKTVVSNQNILIYCSTLSNLSIK